MSSFLVIGYGSIGKKHSSILRELGHDVVTVDRNPNAGADAIHYPSVEYQPDGILLCTHPPRDKAMSIVPSMLTDPPCWFVEKPVGSEARLLSSDRTMVGLCYRWDSWMIDFLTALLPSRIYSVNVSAGHWLPDWHKKPYTHRYHGTLGIGGVINDSLPHALFMAQWILGELSYVGSITEHLSGLDIQTEDVCDVLLRSKTGVPCHIHVDYLRQPREFTIEVVTSNGMKHWAFDPVRADMMYKTQMVAFAQMCSGELRYGYPTLATWKPIGRIMDRVRGIQSIRYDVSKCSSLHDSTDATEWAHAGYWDSDKEYAI